MSAVGASQPRDERQTLGGIEFAIDPRVDRRR